MVLVRLDGGLARLHQPRQVLRNLLAQPELVVAPGVYDGLSARIIEDAGFPAAYMSGGAVARSKGIPDLGLLSLTEVVSRAAEIVDAVDIPIIADADTGYGGNLNVARTIREFERSGVAAIHIEDQTLPKRCGHYDGQSVVDVPTMLGRLRAAIDARSDPDFVIIARTDARAVTTLADAIARVQVYANAGADVVFVEAPQSVEEIRTIAREVGSSLVINMFSGGKTPLLSAQQLQDLGYRLMIVPSDLQRAAIYGMSGVARALREAGSSASFAHRMVSFGDRESVVRHDEYAALADKYDGYPLPPGG
jgi:2-methylisocitrate lyase-like PEP mutase family enzyme